MEQNVLGYLKIVVSSDLAKELPSHFSAEGLSQLAGILLSNIESGERPLLGELWPLYRQHFHVLRYLQSRLTFSLLSDLPAELIPRAMLRFKVQADFGV